jgi:hypothetical protein
MVKLIIELKSGSRIELESVNWKLLVDGINRASGASSLNTLNSFVIWDDLLLNINEIAAAYLKRVKE